VLCHGDEGPSATRFSLAGTVYRTRDADVPLVNATVRVIDFTGLQASAQTNEAGNFYLSPEKFDPSWPLWVRVEAEGAEAEMTSPIQREGSCASCHQGQGSPSSAAQVYLWEVEPEAGAP
jgi:hypothetical protein